MIPYSKLRSQPRVDLAADAPLDSPLTVYCELTNRCNLRCTVCPESHPDYARIAGGIRTMSADDLILVADQLATVNVKSLYLHSLGEPMLNPHCVAFVSMVRSSVERICLTTNGTVPLVKLLDCPPDYVRISVYGLDQLSFEKTTQSTLDHRRVFDNVKALWQERERRKQQVGLDGLQTHPYIYVKGFGKFSPLHYKYKDICDEIDVEPTMDWNGEGEWGGRGEDHSKRVCPAPFYMLAIHSDLRVSMCGVDWSKRLVVGDLRRQSLRAIWQGRAAQQIRLKHLHGERCSLEGCKNCTYLHTTLPDNLDALSAETYQQRCLEAACASV